MVHVGSHVDKEILAHLKYYGSSIGSRVFFALIQISG